MDHLRQHIDFKQLALEIVYGFSVGYKLPADLRLEDLSLDYSVNKREGG
jgi:hypothetical protein